MKLLLLTCFVALGLLANAQTPRPTRTPASGKTTRPRSAQRPKTTAPPPAAPPAMAYKDTLYRLDKSALLVKIDELAETSVIYRTAATGTARQSVARAEVWKVVFSDGSQEVITPLGGNGANNLAKTPDPSASATSPTPAGQAADYPARNRLAAYTKDKQFSRFHLTIGPEVAYYPDFLNKGRAWLNDSTGFGMKQNVGASIRVDYQFVRPLALSFTAGYYGWELTRKYTRNATTEYSETKRLTQIPVQVGLKIYPLGGLYLMPEGGTTLIFSSVSTSENHPTPANESVRSMPITYGGSLGYEVRGKALLLDLSLRYQLFNVKNLQFTDFQQTLSEQVSIASFRLGIGFHSPKK